MGQKEHRTTKVTVVSKWAMLQKAGREITLKNYKTILSLRKGGKHRVTE